MAATLEHDDIQLLVHRGHGRLRAARFLFLQMSPERYAEARKWLSELAGQISVGSDAPTKPAEAAIHLAVAASGLEKLGMPPGVMDTFLREFREGMADPDRARGLGDVGESAPENWDFGGRRADAQVDLLLMLYAAADRELNDLAAAHQTRIDAAGLRVVARHDTMLDLTNRESFGFVDGLSQPRVEGIVPDGEVDRPGDPVVRAGEFILGYENGYDKVPFSPHVPEVLDTGGLLADLAGQPGFKDFGRNGTYLVIRKLEQDVAAFQSFIDDRAVDPKTGVADPSRADWLAAKLMGRWRSGAPVTRARDRDDPALAIDPDQNNAFDYHGDDEGLGCPFGAHTRRANPRHPLAALHRIIRRGRPYEEQRSDGAGGHQPARGILFVALNANIGRQFEFIQQSWMNDPNFEGLQANRDPIGGANYQPSGKEPLESYAMVVPADPFRIRLTGVTRFVHTRGGEYFFLPGRKAIRFLASLGYESRPDLMSSSPGGDLRAAPMAGAEPGPRSASDSISARASSVYQGIPIEEN